MPWYGWAIVALMALNALVAIGVVNKPREPITPSVAIATLLVNGLIIWGVLSLGLQHG